MRGFLLRSVLTVATLGAASSALAADLDYGVLRGPEDDYVAAPIVDWSGFYFGGHGGYTTSNFGYGKAGQADLELILQGLALEQEFHVSSANKLRDARAHNGSFGAFGGYNIQFDELVLGFELDYTSAFQKGSAFGELSRKAALSSGLYDNYTITTQTRAVLEDYATIRARAGYALGSFMPYVTAGGAIGRAMVGTQVHAHIDESTDIAGQNIVGTLDKGSGWYKEKYRFGATFGLGADYLVTQNIFVRGEYQYVLFDKFVDTRVNVNTIRGAVGVKF